MCIIRPASDHLPVIMDIALNKKSLSASHVTGKHAKKRKNSDCGHMLLKNCFSRWRIKKASD